MFLVQHFGSFGSNQYDREILTTQLFTNELPVVRTCIMQPVLFHGSLIGKINAITNSIIYMKYITDISRESYR